MDRALSQRATPRQLLMFLIMCAIWGFTWIAVKLAVREVPPVLLAAARFVATALILFGIVRLRRIEAGALRAARGVLGRLVLAAVLINTCCYAPLFWGIARVPTGIGAVINMALIPPALMLLALAFGEERFSRRKLAGVVLGILGLAILFWPRIAAAGAPDAATELWGMAAIVLATLFYCLGSVLSRPLLRVLPTYTLSALHALIGGTGLLIVSLLTEPVGELEGAALLQPEVWLSWLYLVLLGSVVGFTIFLDLLRDWGPTRAGLYSFVSPAIAVVGGLIVFDEAFGTWEAAGSLVMLAAAGIALTERTGSLQGGSDGA